MKSVDRQHPGNGAIKRAALTAALALPDAPSEGYVTAFYKIAEVMGLPAQPESPAVIFERDMFPRLKGAFAVLPDAEPVAWAIFAENRLIRIWDNEQPHLHRMADEQGLSLVKLYTAPQPAIAPEPVKCATPPEGWNCTRYAGHSGPCAAVKTPPPGPPPGPPNRVLKYGF